MSPTINFYKQKVTEQADQLKLLWQVSEHISGNWNLDQVLEKTVEVIRTYMKSNSCFVYLVEEQDLVLAASFNPHRRELGKVRMKVGEGITGWAAQHKQTVALPAQAYDDPRFKLFNNLPEDKFEAFLSIPITAHGKVIGVINTQNKKRSKFGREKIAFLEIIARQIGTAVDNARLVSETNVLKQALETRKLVEKAKGILMKKHAVTEAEAHKLLNKMSMDNRKSLQEIAEAVIMASEVESRLGV